MNYYENIKEQLINNEIYKKVKDYSKNKNELETYYNVGKLLIEAQGGEERAKYGDGLIKEYSKNLIREVGKKYSTRLLYKMIKYYKFMKKEKVPTLSAKLSWSHFDEILSIDDINKINYYIKICEEQNLSVRKLREKIKLNEYERLSDETKNKLIKKQENNIEDFIKHPIILKNKHNYNKISEKVLKQIILEDIPSFLEQLGEGYSFIKDEYPLKIGNNYNYIDLLLFNYKFNSFVVVELKIKELKHKDLGQIQVYMNYIDKNIKMINQNNTIGIIVCYKNNELVIEYSSDPRIYVTEYEIV